MKPRPDWTIKFPAIDGIAKPSQCNQSDRYHTRYTPETPAIREDVQAILDMPQEEFQIWLDQKRDAATQLLNMWAAVGDIPELSYGLDAHTMTANTAFKANLEVLQKAMSYLTVIEARYNEVNFNF